MIKTKICSNINCIHNKEPQPITNFWLDKSKKDRHRCYCKDCERKINGIDRKNYFLEYRKNHKSEIKNYNQKFFWKYQTPEFKEKNKIYRNSFAKYSTYMVKSNILELFENVRQDPNNSELIQVKCKNSKCDSWFNPKNAQVQRRLSAFNGTLESPRKQNFFYCCEECKDLCLLYNYDSKQEQKKIRKKSINDSACGRHDALQQQLSSIIFGMDDYVCQKCGADKKKNKKIILHCHHIVPFAIDLSLSSDIINCITLCSKCHSLIHNTVDNCSYKNISKTKKLKTKKS